jgi:dTDP-4-amino-4,6-dideoxygalactose transaminase
VVQSIPINDLGRHNACLREALSRALESVLVDGWYVLGPRVAEFEKRFAAYCGVAHCVGTANGTEAIELGLRAVGVRPGSRVVTVANAGGYSTTAILAIGATPLLVDVTPSTGLLCPERLEIALREPVDAVVVTHLYGQMAPMREILSLTSPRGIPVVEDCAQAHGARLEGQAAGAWAACGSFSFYPTKNLGALGDGGAVVTRDAAIAERLRSLRCYGWREKYEIVSTGGMNSRLDVMQAAVLLEKLPFLDEWNDRRRSIARQYSAGLPSIPTVRGGAAGLDDVCHQFVVRVPNREAIRRGMTAAGIGTEVHYPIADHRQPAWAAAPWAQVSLPNTEASCRKVLSLPCYPELTVDEVGQVVTAMLEASRLLGGDQD